MDLLYHQGVFNKHRAAFLLVLLAGALAYSNSFSVPFVFDDNLFITDPRTRGFLWPLWRALLPLPYCEPFMYRPLVLFSLALNHAVSGLHPWSYHLTNLGIHLLNAILLMKLVRRSASENFSLAVALLWAVHPLQTESVTYIYQRAESLMALFTLLTLHALIRSTESPRRGMWRAFAIAACAAGMAGKQTMGVAPLLVLAYDRIFLAGSWRRLFSQRKGFYLALAATWGIVPLLLAASNNAVPSSAGPAYLNQVNSWGYAGTQPSILLHYLRLVFWPRPLILDYGWPIETDPAVLFPSILAVGSLLLATGWTSRRRPELGFLGLWFFLPLVPGFFPCRTLAAEHRMYLPLAAIVTLCVLAVRAVIRSAALRTTLLALTVLLLGTVTFQRNRTYQNPITLWAENATVRPGNALAFYNLGFNLMAQKRLEGASLAYRETLRLDPTFDKAYINLGLILQSQGRTADALELYLQVFRLKPGDATAPNNIGTVLFQQGKWDAAAAWFSRAVQLDPGYREARRNWAETSKLLKGHP